MWGHVWCACSVSSIHVHFLEWAESRVRSTRRARREPFVLTALQLIEQAQTVELRLWDQALRVERLSLNWSSDCRFDVPKSKSGLSQCLDLHELSWSCHPFLALRVRFVVQHVCTRTQRSLSTGIRHNGGQTSGALRQQTRGLGPEPSCIWQECEGM